MNKVNKRKENKKKIRVIEEKRVIEGKQSYNYKKEVILKRNNKSKRKFK